MVIGEHNRLLLKGHWRYLQSPKGDWSRSNKIKFLKILQATIFDHSILYKKILRLTSFQILFGSKITFCTNFQN